MSPIESEKEKERLKYLKGIQNTRKQIEDRQNHLTALKMMYVMYFCPFKKGDKVKVANKSHKLFESVGIVYATFMDEKTGEFYYQLKKVLKDGSQSQIDLWHPKLDTTYEKVEEGVHV